MQGIRGESSQVFYLRHSTVVFRGVNIGSVIIVFLHQLIMKMTIIGISFGVLPYHLIRPLINHKVPWKEILYFSVNTPNTSCYNNRDYTFHNTFVLGIYSGMQHASTHLLTVDFDTVSATDLRRSDRDFTIVYL